MKQRWGIWVGFLAALLSLSLLSAGCSLLLDLKECDNDSDCVSQKRCDDGVCLPR